MSYAVSEAVAVGRDYYSLKNSPHIIFSRQHALEKTFRRLLDASRAELAIPEAIPSAPT
jgi:hypothetical protein